MSSVGALSVLLRLLLFVLLLFDDSVVVPKTNRQLVRFVEAGKRQELSIGAYSLPEGVIDLSIFCHSTSACCVDKHTTESVVEMSDQNKTTTTHGDNNG